MFDNGLVHEASPGMKSLRHLMEFRGDDNAASKAAALRLGLTFEGIFRQHMIVKGRSRDTARFSMTHGEWPDIGARFRTWLSDDNFDADLHQKKVLQAS
jgi:hypothetical protein